MRISSKASLSDGRFRPFHEWLRELPSRHGRNSLIHETVIQVSDPVTSLLQLGISRGRWDACYTHDLPAGLRSSKLNLANCSDLSKLLSRVFIVQKRGPHVPFCDQVTNS